MPRNMLFAAVAALLAASVCKARRKELSVQGSAGEQLLGWGSQCSKSSQCYSLEGGLVCAEGLCACDAAAGYEYDPVSRGCEQSIGFLCLQDAAGSLGAADCFRASDCMDEAGEPVACPKEERNVRADINTMDVVDPLTYKELDCWLLAFHHW